MEEQEKDIQLDPVEEPTVEFKLNSDRSVYRITNQELNEPLVEIVGYGLQINFNMQYLRSIEDIEAAKEGIAKLFGEIIMDKLLEYRKQST